MEVKNLNQQTPDNPDNQSETTSDKLQTTQTNRHRDVLLLSAPYLHIFVPIFVPISVPVQVYRSETTITHLYKPYPPPPYLGAWKSW